VVVWCTGNALVSIYTVNLRQAELGWVAVCGFNSRYLTSHPPTQVNSAWLSLLGWAQWVLQSKGRCGSCVGGTI